MNYSRRIDTITELLGHRKLVHHIRSENSTTKHSAEKTIWKE